MIISTIQTGIAATIPGLYLYLAWSVTLQLWDSSYMNQRKKLANELQNCQICVL